MSLLLLDCRPHQHSELSHIETAITLTISSFMLHPGTRATCPSALSTPTPLTRSASPRAARRPLCCSMTRPRPGKSQNPALLPRCQGLLLQKLRDDGCQACYLQGGFNKFQSTQSTAKTNVNSWSWLSGSLPTAALGLGAHRSASHRESDRELPSSATSSDGSPVPSSQPAFPVQSLPYLCLGRAKNSTNLDELGK